MTDIEQYIKYHNEINFKYSYLNESQKHIDDIDVYAETISNKILTEFNNKHINLSNIIVHKEDIPLNNVFFDELHFINSIIINDKENLPADFGCYCPEKSGIDKDGKYIVYIQLNMTAGIDYIKNELPVLLAHEIAHAYEDYNKFPNTSIEDKNFSEDENRKNGYIYMATSSDSYIVRKLAAILLFIKPSEVSAMKNEVFEELIARRLSIRDNKLANEVLKKTRVYKRIVYTEKCLHEIETAPSELRFYILNTYNEIYNTNISVQDYNKFLIKLNSRFSKARNKIISAASNALIYAYGGRNNPWSY